jgi:lipoprotein-anchoring transpeptidase ErfK/SrfK
MAKAKKSEENSAPIEPVEDKNLDVSSEVAEAMAEDQVEKTEKIEVKEEASTSEIEDKPEEGNLMADESPDQSQVESEVAPEPIVEEKTEVKTSSANNKKAKSTKTSWWQTSLVVSGLVLTALIFIAGGFTQLYKSKVLPNISVAGVDAGGKTEQQIKEQLQTRVDELKLTLKSDKKTLNPKLKDIGFTVDVNKTAEAAVQAKRDKLFSKFAFWQKKNVPAAVKVNNVILSQYLDNKLPKLTKAGQDSRLEYSLQAGGFIITNHKDGTGPNALAVKASLEEISNDLSSKVVEVTTTKKPAKITKEKLVELVEPANQIVAHTVVLKGTSGSFQAQPTDIAQWITPTPQKDGSLKLVIDEGKVQSYVESIGNQIASKPQDKKVVKDKKTGKQVVLQQGHDGTELADREQLASQIAEAIKNGEDITLTMNIKIAKAKTINLEGYDKWIEVDLTKQTATAYEHATPVNNFIIASGLPGYDTPTGEYAIWLKVRSQTMVGGSKADGSYYNLPNVEWVSYFYQDYALHGAWWRKVWGVPGSHGCVNMTNEDAKWVYNWAPVGTKVIVHY